jgi:hypothetical protein
MSLINRCSMIIYPLVPFYEWQNELFPDDLLKIPDELLKNDKATVFLIPDFETEIDFEKWIIKNYKIFFEGIIEDWVTDNSLWPKKLSYDLFKKWFHVSFHTMVYDTLETPIIKEEDNFDEDYF